MNIQVFYIPQKNENTIILLQNGENILNKYLKKLKQ